MAQFNFDVDTRPMAESIDHMSDKVLATTAAVTAMESAVIAAEAASAKKISQNVDNGFYNLIRSQVSLKLAAYFTDMNAKLALMLELSKALQQSKSRMESDFNRLRREYFKIFHSLDRALENRIQQLDSPAMNLDSAKKTVIFRRQLKDIPETRCAANEISSTEQLAVSARLKSKTSRALSFLGRKVQENNQYRDQMDRIVDRTPSDIQKDEYIPVVIASEQSMVQADSYVTQIYYPDYLPENLKGTVGLDIMNQSSALLNAGSNSAQEKQEISREFYGMLSASGLDERTARLTGLLFENGGLS